VGRGSGFSGALALGGLLLLGLRRRRRAWLAAGALGLAGCAAQDGGRDLDGLPGDRSDEACGDEDHEADPGDDDDGGAGDPKGPQVCYSGADGQGTTCLPIVSGDPYTYPSPLDDNYREPIAWLDVEAIDLSTPVAPNFRLSEFAAPHKGQFQVVQPHAVEKLQRVRNQVGALTVNSGYRSPTYNAQVGGATRSRHMYGDAFDVVGSVGQQTLMNACSAQGAGYVAKYASGHVHCDWRNDPVDPLFYGSLAAVEGELRPLYTVEDLAARVVELPDGRLSVEAEGYDAEEGPLLNEWLAFDAAGEPLAESTDLAFTPPPGTATVTVIVGGLLEIEHTL
jgi:hypothetical protein